MFCLVPRRFYFFFFFNDTATTEIYTLSLHDALPISWRACFFSAASWSFKVRSTSSGRERFTSRSEEHTSELQSHSDLVCRLLLEKKKNTPTERSTALRLRPTQRNGDVTSHAALRLLQ